MKFAIYKDYDGDQFVGYVEIVDVDLLSELQHCAIVPALIFGEDRQWSLKDFGLVPRVRVDTRPQKELGEMHPSVADVLQHFDYEHLPPALQSVSKQFHDLAYEMADTLEGPQLTIGLHKLLESKDCMVRAARTMTVR